MSVFIPGKGIIPDNTEASKKPGQGSDLTSGAYWSPGTNNMNMAQIDINNGLTGPEDCPKFIKCPHGAKTSSEFSKVSAPTES